MIVYTLPGRMEVTFEEDVNAILDTWLSYGVSLEEFDEAILGRALPYGRERGVTAWIVDSSGATGAFPREIQDHIATEVFPRFVEAGITHFLTIPSRRSAATKLSVRSYQAQVGPSGLELVEVGSVADAKAWLREHRNGGGRE